jgi:hypothetical protein
MDIEYFNTIYYLNVKWYVFVETQHFHSWRFNVNTFSLVYMDLLLKPDFGRVFSDYRQKRDNIRTPLHLEIIKI